MLNKIFTEIGTGILVVVGLFWR